MAIALANLARAYNYTRFAVTPQNLSQWKKKKPAWGKWPAAWRAYNQKLERERARKKCMRDWYTAKLRHLIHARARLTSGAELMRKLWNSMGGAAALRCRWDNVRLFKLMTLCRSFFFSLFYRRSKCFVLHLPSALWKFCIFGVMSSFFLYPFHFFL